jgi:SAM-dependent methyltransferase
MTTTAAPAAAVANLHTSVRREIVARQLAGHLARLRERGPLRVLDAGCGAASPALLLARAGHVVTAVHTDTTLLTSMHAELMREAPEVQARLRLVEGDGAEAGRHFTPGSFDLALAHDALEQLPEPDGILAALSRVLTQGGLMSVTSRNVDSLAMRAGSLGQWNNTRKALDATTFPNPSGPGTLRADSVSALTTVLADLGTPVLEWYGVGVFSGMQPDDAPVPKAGKAWQTLISCEEDAGRREPYRGVAPTLHLVGEKTVR